MKLILSYILFVLACVLLVIIGFSVIFLAVVTSFFTGEAPEYFLNMAIGIDQLGNVLISPVANVLLIKKNGYQFGVIDETISSVLGKNQQFNTLRLPGRLIAGILDFIDKDHCKKSIDLSV